jgi:hypothetical protein
MRSRFVALFALLALMGSSLLFTVGCTQTDDDDATGDQWAYIELFYPAAGATDVFKGDTLWVQFDSDVPPTSMTLSVTDATGASVPGQQDADGLRYFFKTTDELASSSSYTLTAAFEPSETGEPAAIPFQTGPWGDLLGSDSEDLVDLTFRFDLDSGIWLKPEGVGSLIGGLLDGMGLAFAVTDASTFEPGGQPGIHLNGALVVLEGGTWEQDRCTPTLPYTYGPDGVTGTGDDAPASWIDPAITFGPEDLELAVSGIEALIKDFYMDGVVHPELEDLRGIELSGSADTRALDSVVSDDAEEGAVCELVDELAGIPCIECGAPNPGEFCLELHIVDLTAESVPNVTIETLDCADIITEFLAGDSSCEEDVLDYDPNGDSSYSDCPAWIAK